jgi:hypothetical protein
VGFVVDKVAPGQVFSEYFHSTKFSILTITRGRYNRPVSGRRAEWTFPFKYLLSYPHDAEWTPFQTHYFSENLVAPGIEAGTSGSAVKNSDH